MSHTFRLCSLTAGLLALAVGMASAAPAGLDKTGKPDLKSAGPLAFGPKGVLFIGDPQGAQIFVIGVGGASELTGVRLQNSLERTTMSHSVTAAAPTSVPEADPETWDAIVVGAGPGGLTCAASSMALVASLRSARNSSGVNV